MGHPKRAITRDIRARRPKRATREQMTWGPVTVRPSTGIRKAAHLMHANKIGAPPLRPILEARPC
jgi:CBS domain-containing protein